MGQVTATAFHEPSKVIEVTTSVEELQAKAIAAGFEIGTEKYWE